MNNQKIFLSHGDIILDKIYDDDFNLLTQAGGGCNWNSLYNLAYMGEKCYAFGSVGNDIEGEIALSSFKNVNINININGVIVENIPTNIMNIIIPNKNLDDNTIIHTWYSPTTYKRTINFSNNLPNNIPEELKNNDLFVILDKFRPINLEFINNISNKKVCLDIGHIRFLEEFTGEYLHTFFKQANLIQLNHNVSKPLFEMLNIENEIDFFNLLNLDLLIVTNGKKGATFYYTENSKLQIIQKTPKIIETIVDSSGAGDAFFATTIRQYAYSNTINKHFIDDTFELANMNSREVIKQIGSRRKKTP